MGWVTQPQLKCLLSDAGAKPAPAAAAAAAAVYICKVQTCICRRPGTHAKPMLGAAGSLAFGLSGICSCYLPRLLLLLHALLLVAVGESTRHSMLITKPAVMQLSCNGGMLLHCSLARLLVLQPPAKSFASIAVHSQVQQLQKISCHQQHSRPLAVPAAVAVSPLLIDRTAPSWVLPQPLQAAHTGVDSSCAAAVLCHHVPCQTAHLADC